jgi:hypothetical protein
MGNLRARVLCENCVGDVEDQTDAIPAHLARTSKADVEYVEDAHRADVDDWPAVAEFLGALDPLGAIRRPRLGPATIARSGPDTDSV